MRRLIAGFALAFLLGLGGLVLGRTWLLESRQIAAEPASAIAIDAEIAARHLAGAIRIRTISHGTGAKAEAKAFRKLHAYLAKTYPRVHAALTRETVADFSLLYHWKGTDPDLKPLLLLAHLDVVPIEPGTIAAWTHPPFDGVVAEGFVWGRGAMDDKASLIAIFEAVEYLLQEDFQPARSIYLAFGHDEEIGGFQGGAAIAELLKSRGIVFEFTLDEGLVIAIDQMPGVKAPVALIGVAEKGYVSLELLARAEGGHSSMPPPETAIGRLARAIRRLERHPMPAALRGPAAEMFAAVAPEMDFSLRLQFANRWLFDPFLLRRLEEMPATNGMIRTTTAPTMLAGGIKDNVLPSEVRAVVNFRTLPGETSAGVIDHVKRALDDPGVAVRSLDPVFEPSPVSATDSAPFRLLTRTIREIFPDVIVAPGLVLGGTDTKHYVGLSEASFRFLPLRLTSDDLKGIHGTNERLAVTNVGEIVHFYTQLMRSAGGQ
ncbi:MAG: M20 family peptidase [Alphaproteobacteria bacterium]|nr:M20 family peptidase [Alphaproteobacteria bacterium]